MSKALRSVGFALVLAVGIVVVVVRGACDALYRLLAKEPVFLGSAVTAVYEAAYPETESLWKVAVGAVVAWVVRCLSTPTVVAAERVAEVAEVAHIEGYRKAEDDLVELDPEALNPERDRARKPAA